jgi:hypothetical protein
MLTLMASQNTEEELIDRAREGDRTAFDELASAQRNRLEKLVRFVSAPASGAT